MFRRNSFICFEPSLPQGPEGHQTIVIEFSKKYDAPIINNISNILFLLYSFICFEPSLPQGLVGHQASSSYFPKNVYSNAMNQIWYVKERYVLCYYKFLTYTLIGPPPLFHKRQKVTRTSSSYLPNKDIAMDKFRFHFVTEIDENKNQRHWTWSYSLY